MNVLDTLRAALRRAQQKHPGLTPAAQEDALLEILAALGGEQVVIPKTTRGRGPPPLPDDVQERVFKDALSTTASTAELVGRHGISRASFYRLMKKGPPSSRKR